MIAGRLAQSFVVLAVMSFVIYGLMGLMPGDPIDLMTAADPNLTPADAQRLKALYGLDRPWTERYLRWLAQVAQGELGYSRLFAKPVLDALRAELLRNVEEICAEMRRADQLERRDAVAVGCYRGEEVERGQRHRPRENAFLPQVGDDVLPFTRPQRAGRQPHRAQRVVAYAQPVHAGPGHTRRRAEGQGIVTYQPGSRTREREREGEALLTADGAQRGDTCHLDVIDRHGNMVSATPSGGWLGVTTAIQR